MKTIFQKKYNIYRLCGAVKVSLILIWILGGALFASENIKEIEKFKVNKNFVGLETYLDSLFKKAVNRSDSDNIADEWFKLSNEWVFQNNYIKAVDIINKAEPIYSGLNDSLMIIYVYFYKANYLWHIQRYSESLISLGKSFSLYDKFGKKNPALYYSLIKELAIIKSLLGEKAESEKYFNELIRYYGQKQDDSSLGGIYIMLGRMYAKEQDLDRADSCFRIALGKSLYISDRKLRADRLSAVYNNLGELEYKKGNYTSAIELIKQALRNQNEYQAQMDVIYSDLGGVYLSCSRLHEAEQAFIAALDKNSVSWGAYSGLARVAERRKDWAAADSLHSKAVREAESRAQYLEGKAIVSYFEKVALVYKDAARYYATRNQLSKCFEISESYRARYLSYLADLAYYKITKGVDPILRDSLKILEQSVEVYYKRKGNKNNNSALDDIAVKSLEIQIGELKKNIRRDFPAFHTLINPVVVNLGNLQKHLGNQYQILEYTLVRDSLVGLVISEHEIKSRVVPVNPDRLGKDIRHALESFNGPLDIHYALYRELFKPFESYISPDKELIIVPDGVLYYLPFEMLLMAPPDEKTDAITPRYLIYKYSISYAPSASYFFGGLGRSVAAPVNYGGFGAGRFSIMRNLKHVTNQVSGSGDILSNADIFTDQTRFKDEIRSKASDYKIIDFATHVVISDVEPVLSRIVFYDDSVLMSDSAGLDRSALFGYEIFNLDLSADLVVLSGCRSGLGELSEGEGIIGFNHAFTYAGAKSVLVSLWPVEDESTAELMKYFYSYLKKGYSKSKALRGAKLEYLNTAYPVKRNPRFWAAYTLWGNPEKIELNEGISSLQIFVGILTLLLLILTGLFFIRKRFTRS